jgi:hypothetical protein
MFVFSVTNNALKDMTFVADFTDSENIGVSVIPPKLEPQTKGVKKA